MEKLFQAVYGGILYGLFQKAVGLPLTAQRTFALHNAGISRIAVSGDRWRLLSWNESRHLRGLDPADDWDVRQDSRELKARI